MKSVLGTSARTPKASPLEGSGPFRVQASGIGLQQLSRSEWWLWLSALLVTVLSAVAFILSSIHSFFRHADYFYEIRSDQARWATLCLILVFNGWLVYRQWSFRHLRRQSIAEPSAHGDAPQPFSEASGLDPITGLYSRSSLEQHIGKEVARARRQNSALSLATVHIEEYAEFVRQYGKAAVDAALKELARRMKRASRGSDIAARLNDDDFLLLLPECGLNEVKQVLNRLGVVEVSSSGQKIPLNFTTGFVDYQPGELPANLLKRAAELLHLYDTAAQSSLAPTLVSH